jgi:hypothetical protein
MANLRRTGGLGKNPKRAAARAAQLTEIDADWNCPWPLDRQRHYRHLAHLAADEPDGVLPDIAPGVLMDGDDIGRWLQRQRRDWRLLSTEQQERLSRLGVQPAQAPASAPAAEGASKGPRRAQHAFQRGLAALAQRVEWEGADRPVPRKAVEVLPDGTETKLGVWVSNTRSRRDKLTTGQVQALRKLGVEGRSRRQWLTSSPGQRASPLVLPALVVIGTGTGPRRCTAARDTGAPPKGCVPIPPAPPHFCALCSSWRKLEVNC